MLIDNNVRKCVVFLFYKKEGGYKLAGTGFFYGTPFTDGSDRNFVNVVTAKHVIQGIQSKSEDQKVYFRINDSDGLKWSAMETSKWLFHPSDESVDVAVTLFEYWTPQIDHLMLNDSSVVTPELVKNESIGLGDEIYIAGLFRNHYGSLKNIPIIRIGNIAAMREEKVNFRGQAVDAYLIESRSIGGLSGSLVFVNMGLHRRIDGTIKQSTGEILRWLGLISGHWDIDEESIDSTTEDEGTKNINMGIAVVVPVDRILEVINQPSLVAARALAMT